MSNFSLTAQTVRRCLITSIATLVLAFGLFGNAIANDNHTNEASTQDQTINESFNKGVQGQSLQGKLRTTTLENYSFETCITGETLEKALAFPVENNTVSNGQLCYSLQSTAIDFNNRAVNNQINAIHQENIEKTFAVDEVDVNSELYNETLVNNPILYSEYILQHELEAPAEVSKLLINNKYQHLYQVFPAQSYATIQIADKGPRFISLKSQIDQYARTEKGLKLLKSNFANILLLQEQVPAKARTKVATSATPTPAPNTSSTPKPVPDSAKPVTFSDPKAYATLTQSSALTLAPITLPTPQVTPETTPTPTPEVQTTTEASTVHEKVESKPEVKPQATTAPASTNTSATTSRYYVLGARQAFKSNVDYLNFIEYLHKANYVATNAIYGQEFRFYFAGNGVIITYYQDNRYQKPVVVKYAEVKQFLKPLVLKALGIN